MQEDHDMPRPGLSRTEHASLARYWIASEMLVSQVAQFLSRKELGRLLTASKEFLSITLVPSARHVEELVLHTPRPGIRIDPLRILFRNVVDGKVSKEVTYKVLRDLYVLMRSTPEELCLYQGSPAEFIQYPYISIVAERIAESMCRLSTHPRNGGLQPISVEVTVNSKRCSQSRAIGHVVMQCQQEVFVNCRACGQICSACKDHRTRCKACRKGVCPECIVPSHANQGLSPPTYCTKCNFLCFACSWSVHVDDRYTCSADGACLMQNQVCNECVLNEGVLQTLWCQSCDERWCEGCTVAFPVCALCGPTECASCAEMKRCSHCDNTYHHNCFTENGGVSCFQCGTNLCQACYGINADDFQHCSYFNCRAGICQACTTPDRVRVCEHGHRTCIGCVDLSVERCILPTTKFEKLADVDKGCFACWSLKYANALGFESYEQFDAGRRNVPAGVIEQIEPEFKDDVFCFSLGGKTHRDTKPFNTCSALWAQLKSASEGLLNDTAPLSINEILSQVALTVVAVWEKSFVNGVCASVSLVDPLFKPTSLCPTASAVGSHGAPFHNKLILDHDNDERVASVHVRYGAIIDNLRIVTTTGREMTWGGPGGDITTNYRVPEGWKLVGFFGGVGGHLHKLGVVIVANPTRPLPPCYSL